MLNAQYFRTTFAEALRPTDPRQRVELHLKGGGVFEVVAVHAVEEGFVTLDVLPPEDADQASKRTPPIATTAAGPGNTDRLVVAYESITCVHVAPAVRHASRTAGF